MAAGRPPPPSRLRHALNAVYDGAAALAALCMVALLGTVLLSIVSRQLNFNVPGTDAYAGYLMAAAGFLALAHTLKRGEHIRVTLVLGALAAVWQRRLEVFALALSSALAALFAAYSVRLAWVSYALGDVSTSADATPLWLPQLSMAAGTLVLAVAVIDELVLEIIGARMPPQTAEPLRNE